MSAQLSENQMKALIHAAGYVLVHTDLEGYRYYRPELVEAQRVLDRALVAQPVGELLGPRDG